MKKKVIGMAFFCMALLCGCANREEAQHQLELRSQGILLASDGDYEGAVAAYDEALGLSDMKVGKVELDIAAYKASALYHGGKPEEAVAACDAILDLKKNRDVYVMRGLIKRELGDTEAAQADFKAAMDMTSSRDKVMLGRLSYYMEDYSGAKEYLESAYEEGNSEARFWEAELYWQMGNEDYAVTLYQSYVAEDPQQQLAYERVAAYELKQGDYDAALTAIQDGIAMGDAGSLRQLLASEVAVYEQKRDFATAKEKMESYLESYPDDEKAAREYEFLKTR